MKQENITLKILMKRAVTNYYADHLHVQDRPWYLYLYSCSRLRCEATIYFQDFGSHSLGPSSGLLEQA